MEKTMQSRDISPNSREYMVSDRILMASVDRDHDTYTLDLWVYTTENIAVRFGPFQETSLAFSWFEQNADTLSSYFKGVEDERIRRQLEDEKLAQPLRDLGRFRELPTYLPHNARHALSVRNSG